VHLRWDDGSWTWVPLAKLDEQMAATASEIYVDEDDGYIQELERAPLDRVGFVYDFGAGGGTLRGDRNETRTAFASNIGFGFFPAQQLGILAATTLGVGEIDGRTAFTGFFGGELQLFPVGIGAFHPGAYGRVGYALRAHTRERAGGFAWGGGLILQAEVSTRLSLLLRGGVTFTEDPYGRVAGGELTAGFSVY
jgi:hypothetical protein